MKGKTNVLSMENKYRKDRLNKIYINIKKKGDDVCLPDVKLNYTNVYSRLYHNAVLTQALSLQSEKKRKNTVVEFKRRDSNPVSMKRDLSIKNVLDSNIGKEFTMKITDEQVMKCFSKHSGGPTVSRFDKIKTESPILLKDKPVSIDLHNRFIRDVTLDDGNTLLHDAVSNQKLEMIVYLIDKELQINVKNNDGNTPLHLACMAIDNKGCKKNIINLLLDNNADNTIKNGKNELPLDLITDEEMKKQITSEIKLMQRTREVSSSRMK